MLINKLLTGASEKLGKSRQKEKIFYLFSVFAQSNNQINIAQINRRKTFNYIHVGSQKNMRPKASWAVEPYMVSLHLTLLIGL